MNYGLQISASGVLTALYRQDALTNNLANVNTPGFKPHAVHTRQRDPARAEDGLPSMPSSPLLERLGAGVMMAPARVSFRQGPLETTGNALDLAIVGDGFFRVGSASGPARLTRDGRLTVDGAGRLAMVATGLPVLDESGRPIHVGDGAPPTIGPDGTVARAGEVLGRIAVMDAPDRDALVKAGDGLFELPAALAGSLRPAGGRLRQGAIEQAAISEITAMLGVQSASRAVGSNVGMIEYHDRMMERAINTFGRTA